jgi:hypothetical protein
VLVENALNKDSFQNKMKVNRSAKDEEEEEKAKTDVNFFRNTSVVNKTMK